MRARAQHGVPPDTAKIEAKLAKLWQMVLDGRSRSRSTRRRRSVGAARSPQPRPRRLICPTSMTFAQRGRTSPCRNGISCSGRDQEPRHRQGEAPRRARRRPLQGRTRPGLIVVDAVAWLGRRDARCAADHYCRRSPAVENAWRLRAADGASTPTTLVGRRDDVRSAQPEQGRHRNRGRRNSLTTTDSSAAWRTPH